MRLELLDYPLPEHAIAQRPPAERDGARLLMVGDSDVSHHRLIDLVSLVPSGALLVLNDTRVRRSRLRVRKSSGGNVELLVLDTRSSERGVEVWTALAHANRPLRAGAQLQLDSVVLTVISKTQAGELTLEVRGLTDIEGFFERHGQVPLPPYIRRDVAPEDAERYQTVFASHLGSAAAPTAGLHLTHDMLAALKARGVEVGFATLHVGAGTFMPVRAADLDDHDMHPEHFSVSEELARQVANVRARGGPVVAVGTTVVRALESSHDASRPGHVRACEGQTRLLVQPGYDFEIVDALLTNFHAPRSTLLALVSAFAGPRRAAAAYRLALAAEYRFLSYGDAMWLPRRFASDFPDAGDGERYGNRAL